VIGAGCREPHVGCLSYGTTATINTTSTRYVEVTPFIPPYPAAIPGAYSNEVQVFRGYWMVNWFKEQFGHHEQQRALAEDVAPEQLFDQLASTVPPGSMGLMLQPYWTPGIRVPGRKRRAASSASATCTRAPTSTAPSWKAWPTRCARGRSGSRSAAAWRSRNCACPAAARRATARCS
jgi:sugar (pentulose or hexulose) kinase